MAVPASTTVTFSQVGIREQLANVINNIMPEETPFYSMCRSSSASSRTPEWMREVDADPVPTNAVVEGDDVANDSGGQPTRLKNVTQIFDKVVGVSSTSRAVTAAGRSDELRKQLAQKGRELKRDIETRFQGNYASVLGNASTAGQCGGAEAFIASNASRGATGANGGYNTGTGIIDAATDGTLRVVTETLFKDVIADAWTNGGEPTVVLCGAKMKQKISSTFTGVAALSNEVGNPNRVVSVGAVDFYRSDFGQHKIVPTRLGSYGTGRTRPYRPSTVAEYDTANRSILVLTPRVWAKRFLQPIQQKEIATLGHSDRRMIYCEVTLECSEERANGIVADVKVA